MESDTNPSSAAHFPVVIMQLTFNQLIVHANSYCCPLQADFISTLMEHTQQHTMIPTGRG